YLKKIVLAIALIGLVIMGVFSYYVYKTLLAPNTAFNQNKADVYIKTNAQYDQVFDQLKPLLKDPDKFDIVAHKKKYVHNIKAGHYIIKKGMSNNDIITSLRSRNIPISVVFNNQNRLSELAHRIATQIEADSSALMDKMTDSTFLAKNNFT